MKFTKAFIKTNKEAKEYDSINATLLQKGAFVDQTMAGVYSYLPLGLRVLHNIESTIRDEISKVGSEILLPSIVPEALWQATGRLDTVDVLFAATPANDLSKIKNDAKYILNSTHEEVITPIAKKIKLSYRDLPFAVFQIQTKFRNEERPKSGLLRGREFRMKDLYSFHASDEDRIEYYENVKDVYMKIFDRLDIAKDTVITLASGGDFTNDYSHEFNTKCSTGEDWVYFDDNEGVYYNKEVASEDLKNNVEPFSASEVGNIFPLGTKFSDAIDYFFTTESGAKEPVHMASYGIGSSRIMGVLVEKFNDENGIIWPKSVAPFMVHLVGLNLDDEEVVNKADKIYKTLEEANIDVLFDDRLAASPGEKLSDADLIGCPWRVVVSKKTGEKIEIKKRTESDSTLVSPDEFVKMVSHEAV